MPFGWTDKLLKWSKLIATGCRYVSRLGDRQHKVTGREHRNLQLADRCWHFLASPLGRVGSSCHIGCWGNGEVAESLLSHGFDDCWWCLENWFTCRLRDRRRDDTRSDPSHELLGIFNKICWQGETRHTLPCCHPIRRKQKDKHISLYKQ